MGITDESLWFVGIFHGRNSADCRRPPAGCPSFSLFTAIICPAALVASRTEPPGRDARALRTTLQPAGQPERATQTYLSRALHGLTPGPTVVGSFRVFKAHNFLLGG
jgi:hypothetical protein